MTFPNQADTNYIGAPAANTWQFCTYMWFWWREAPVTYQGLTGSGMNIVAKSFPGNLKNKNELQILDQDTNKMKERLVYTCLTKMTVPRADRFQIMGHWCGSN